MIRWLADVESYDIEFRHIPSTSNTAADALSRPPEASPLICPLITDRPEHSWLNDYKSDPCSSPLMVLSFPRPTSNTVAFGESTE